MMNDTNPTPSLRPVRALLNGLLVGVLGFAVYLIPGVGIGLRMGYELGSEGTDQQEISRLISTQVGEFYHANVPLIMGGMLVMCLLIFWRAHVVSRDAGRMAPWRGVVVALVPAVVGAFWWVKYHFGVLEILSIVLYLIVGVIGARRGAAVGARPAAPVS